MYLVTEQMGVKVFFFGKGIKSMTRQMFSQDINLVEMQFSVIPRKLFFFGVRGGGS